MKLNTLIIDLTHTHKDNTSYDAGGSLQIILRNTYKIDSRLFSCDAESTREITRRIKCLVKEHKPSILFVIISQDLLKKSERVVPMLKRSKATIIVASKELDPDKIVRLFTLGISDYLRVPFEAVDLIQVLRTHANIRKADSLMSKYNDARKCFITCDPSYLQILDSLQDIAKSDAGVLIVGETGTGKELVAHAIHHLSPRSERPFMALDCGTRTSEMLESELFGHVKGAFTGALSSKVGLVGIAEGGSLFLDEFNSTNYDVQKRLIRFLETHSYYPLGSAKLSNADVRVLAAANYDMGEAMSGGRLREDLYHRLSILEIRIPPLRERIDDIPLLVDHFVQQFKTKYFKPHAFLAEGILPYFVGHPLTGNIRELQNMIERGFVKSRENIIQITDILGVAPQELNFTYDEYSKQASSKAKKHYLRTLLAYHRGVVSSAAEQAGQQRTNFYKTLHEHGFDPDNFRTEKFKK